MSRHPTDVGRAPEHVLGLEVKHPAHRGVDADHIPARGVGDALRLAGAAAGVEDVQQVLGFHLFRGAVGAGVGHQLVPPHVPAGGHGGVQCLPNALHHDALLHGGATLEGFIRGGFQADDFAPPIAPVRGDEEGALTVVDATRQAIRAEPAEDDAVRRADPRAGQHGDQQLGDHGQVDGHAVPALDAQALQHVGEFADLAPKLPVGERPLLTQFAFPKDGDLVPRGRIQVAVQAVVASVELAAVEPAGVGVVPFQDGVPLLEPVELLRQRRPVPVRIPLSAGVDILAVDVGLSDEGLARGEEALFLQQRFNGRLRGLGFVRHADFSVTGARGASGCPKKQE